MRGGKRTVYPAYPCCCNFQHFFPFKQSCFLPPIPEVWIFLLVLCFGRREECNELQLFYQTRRAPIPQTALIDEKNTIYAPPVQNQQSQMNQWSMALQRSILTCSWLLQASSSLHFAVITCKGSRLAEFNLHPLAVKAVTSFWHPTQGWRNQVPSMISPTLNANKINQINI